MSEICPTRRQLDYQNICQIEWKMKSDRMSVGGDHLKESICLLVFDSCPPVFSALCHSFVRPPQSFIQSFMHSCMNSFVRSFIHSFKHAVTKIFVRIGFQRSDFPTSYLLHNIAAPGRSNNIFRAIADGTGKRWRAWRMNCGTGCF